MRLCLKAFSFAAVRLLAAQVPPEDCRISWPVPTSKTRDQPWLSFRARLDHRDRSAAMPSTWTDGLTGFGDHAGMVAAVCALLIAMPWRSFHRVSDVHMCGPQPRYVLHRPESLRWSASCGTTSARAVLYGDTDHWPCRRYGAIAVATKHELYAIRGLRWFEPLSIIQVRTLNDGQTLFLMAPSITTTRKRLARPQISSAFDHFVILAVGLHAPRLRLSRLSE